MKFCWHVWKPQQECTKHCLRLHSVLEKTLKRILGNCLPLLRAWLFVSFRGLFAHCWLVCMSRHYLHPPCIQTLWYAPACHLFPFSYIPCFPMATFLQGTKMLYGETKDDIGSIHSLENKIIANDETSFPDNVKRHTSAEFTWPMFFVWTWHNASHCMVDFWSD